MLDQGGRDVVVDCSWAPKPPACHPFMANFAQSGPRNSRARGPQNAGEDPTTGVGHKGRRSRTWRLASPPPLCQFF